MDFKFILSQVFKKNGSNVHVIGYYILIIDSNWERKSSENFEEKIKQIKNMIK